MAPAVHDVAVVGLGPVGMFLLSQLRRSGLKAIGLEARKALREHPQAHFVNTRSMEILSACSPGLAEAMREQAPREAQWRRFVWASALTGRQLAAADMLDVGGKVESVSPSRPLHLPQDRFEKLLHSRLDPGSWRLDAGVAALEEAHDLVRLRLRDGKDVLAKYVVGCDGAHSTVKDLANIAWDPTSEKDYQSLLNVHFSSRELGHQILWAREDSAPVTPGMLYFVYNPRGVVVFVAHDLERGDFICQVPAFGSMSPNYDPTGKQNLEEAANVVADTIGRRPADLHVHSVRPWHMRTRIASVYHSVGKAGRHATKPGRVFLAGDAAHTFPPAGGFGMNTGLQDAYNLSWKLTSVIKAQTHQLGIDADTLLQSYSIERQPVAVEAATLSDVNYEKTLDCARSLGLDIRLAKAAESLISFLPPPLQKQTMQGALRIGLFPTMALAKEGNIVGDACVEALQKQVQDGRALPLVFPRYELGTTYGKSLWGAASSEEGRRAERDDIETWGRAEMEFRPRIQLGCRVPHMVLSPISRAWFPSWRKGFLSTVDLPAQLEAHFGTTDGKRGGSQVPSGPWAVLLTTSEVQPDIVAALRSSSLPLLNLAHVEVDTERRSRSDSQVEIEHLSSYLARRPGDLVMRRRSAEALRAHLLCADAAGMFGKLVDEVDANVVLLRPDGIVVWYGRAPAYSSSFTDTESFAIALREALRQALVL